MLGRSVGKRARLKWITGAATVIAVLLVVVAGLSVGGWGAARGGTPAVGLAENLVPAALPSTAIDLNRSQSAGMYTPEYVTLNNSTSLVRLPALLTVTADTCKWVVVENLTTSASPASPFHNIEYANETADNASGTVLSHADAFRVCGGSGVWINFVYWTFSIYEFSATGLGVNATVTLGGFSDWGGTTVAPANVSARIGPDSVGKFTVASNLTFIATFEATVNGPNSCDYTGQVCSYTQYSFVSAADSANVSKSPRVVFSHASGLLVTGAYENWTVGYSSATISDNTGVGGFFADTSSFFQEVFVEFWYLWIVGLLGIGLVASVARRKGRGRR